MFQLRRMGIDTQSEHVVFIAERAVREGALGLNPLDRVRVIGRREGEDREIQGILNFCHDSLLEKSQVGLSEVAFLDLDLAPGAEVEICLARPPQSVDRVRDGSEGPIYCTPPTLALCRILLPDSARIHEEDAAYANRKGFSKHAPALPLYTEKDAERALERLVPLEFGETQSLGALSFTIRPAGHILGAGSVSVHGPEGTILFSGDLGRDDDLLMRPPQAPGSPDWLVVESTYGDRRHSELDPIDEIARILNRTLEREGTLLVPTFAVARAQTLAYCLNEIFRRDLAPTVPVFLNSPMATRVTELYQRYDAYHHLSPEQSAVVCGLPHFVRTVEESKELTARGRFRAIILSASGMATGGRVLHHLKNLAPDARNTILLPGFQAPGTRGEAIANGKQAVKIHGEYVPIRAEVVQLDFLSAQPIRRACSAGSVPASAPRDRSSSPTARRCPPTS